MFIFRGMYSKYTFNNIKKHKYFNDVEEDYKTYKEQVKVQKKQKKQKK